MKKKWKRRLMKTFAMSKSSSSSSSSSSSEASEAEDRQDTEPAEDVESRQQSQEEAELDFWLSLDLSARFNLKFNCSLSVLFCYFLLQSSGEPMEYYALEHRSQVSTRRTSSNFQVT